MANRSVLYPSKQYRPGDVHILVSESLIKFFRLTNQHTFQKELIKGLQKATAVAMNEIKNQISAMGIIYSGFMRSNIVAWIDSPKMMRSDDIIYSTIGTRAWYDILVHEGLGIHARPPSFTPFQFLPTEEQKAVAPKWDDVKKLGKHKGKGAGPRPFMTKGIQVSQSKIMKELSEGYFLGLRNTIAMASQIPKHQLTPLDKV